MTDANMSNTTVLGIVGGIASGKSAVTQMLVDMGADHFDADRAGHEVLKQPEVVETLTQRWGRALLDEDGRLIRKRIADQVFGEGSESELAFLNSVTHPRIRQLFDQQLAACQAPVLVVDAALLMEADWDQWCDAVLFVDTPETLRRQRAADRGWTESHWRRREATQLPLAEKRRRATEVIVNDGSLADLREKVAALAPKWGL